MFETYPYLFKCHENNCPAGVAFAMAINKAQDEIFERAGLYLPDPGVFSHGHVAFSIVRRFSDIYVSC